jgi:hypothetical protein
MTDQKSADELFDPHDLTGDDFREMGVQVVAYVRPVKFMERSLYMVHAADGTPMALAESEELALETIDQHDLEPAKVH